MKLNDKLYDFLKYLAIIGLPAFEVFIPIVFNIWGIPYGDEIAKTLNALAVLIGSLLCISVISYNGAKAKANEIVDENKEDLG